MQNVFLFNSLKVLVFYLLIHVIINCSCFTEEASEDSTFCCSTCIYVAGVINDDWYVKKFNCNGVEDTSNWNKKLDGNNGLDIAYSIAIDSNSNVFVSGFGENLKSSNSKADWWIKKFSHDGIEDTTYWNKICDSGSIDLCRSIYIDNNDNVYAVGYGENLISSTSKYDWWIKKFDANGNEDTLNWNKMFDGNSGNDVAYSIDGDTDGNIIIGGYGENLTSSTSKYDWWIKKFDANGNEDTLNWNIIFDNNNKDDKISDLAIDKSNNVFVVGLQNDHEWAIKYFSNNGIEDTSTWNKTIDGSTSYSGASSICINNEDKIYVVGLTGFSIDYSYYYSSIIKEFDTDGNENWEKYLGAIGYSIISDNEKKIYIAGIKDDLFSTRYDGFFLTKYDSTGTLEWEKTYTDGRARVVAIGDK